MCLWQPYIFDYIIYNHVFEVGGNDYLRSNEIPKCSSRICHPVNASHQTPGRRRTLQKKSRVSARVDSIALSVGRSFLVYFFGFCFL